MLPGPLLLQPTSRGAAAICCLPSPIRAKCAAAFSESAHRANACRELNFHLHISLAALPPAVCHSSALRWRALSSTHAQPWLTRELNAVTAEFRYEDMFNVTGIDERVRHSPSPPTKKKFMQHLRARDLSCPSLALTPAFRQITISHLHVIRARSLTRLRVSWPSRTQVT